MWFNMTKPTKKLKDAVPFGNAIYGTDYISGRIMKLSTTVKITLTLSGYVIETQNTFYEVFFTKEKYEEFFTSQMDKFGGITKDASDQEN